MECVEFKDRLLDIFYKEAADTFILEAHAHLQDCPSCHHEWDRLVYVKSLFSALPAREPNRGSLQRVLAVARGSKSFKLLEKVALFPWKGWALQSAPAFVVVFFFMVGLSALFHQKPPQKAQVDDIPSPHFFMPQITTVSEGNTTGLAPVSSDNLEKEYQERYATLLETDADRLLMRGRRFKSMGRMDLALKDFETIYRFYPNYAYMADVLMYRAQCYAFLGEVDKAIKSLKSAMKKDPSRTALIAPMIEQLESSSSLSE